MEKIVNWLVLILGILLILPLVGVDQLGSIVDGTLAWIVALVVIVIGVLLVIKK